MNITEFKKIFNEMSTDVDEKWVNALISKCIDKQGTEITLVRCMEEFAELIQMLSKSLRSTESSDELLEELADAQLCIFFVQQALGISGNDLCKAMNVKLKHAEDRL